MIRVGLLIALAAIAGCLANQQQQEAHDGRHQLELQQRSSTVTKSVKDFLTRKLVHFGDFKSKFNKKYKTESEETLRHALYSERLMKVAKSIMRYYSKQSATYKSISSRSDMTLEERKRLAASRLNSVVSPTSADEIEIVDSPRVPEPEVRVKREVKGKSKKQQPPSSPAFGWFYRMVNVISEPPQKEVNVITTDLRKTGCFYPSGNQGSCDSCASFVAIAQLEYLRCREEGKLEKFSEQFPIDCGGAFGMMGCGGTDVVSLNKFISQVGLASSTSNPYVGRQKRCPYYNKRTRRFNFKSADTLKLKRQGILAAPSSKWSKFLEQNIPLHVGVLANDEFEDYGGGVANSCERSNGVHGLLLVGEGREDGADFWLLRNSYGEDWGLQGYVKLNKKANHCVSDNEMGYYPAAFTHTFGSSFLWNLEDPLTAS